MLRIRRKVRVDLPDNFEMLGPDSLSRLWGQLTGGLVLFMVAVSSVGLMVGGVGVMNIMLVSVTERTREIGIRKAVGATRRNILLQFTPEAITLCAVGGLLAFSPALFTWIATLRPHRASTRPSPRSGSSSPSLFPAASACSSAFTPPGKPRPLDPIEALRYE